MLSPEKLLQIAGRCRHKEGLLSERFIYDIQSKKVWEKNFDKQHNIACAKWIIEIINQINFGLENYNDVIHRNVGQAVADQMSGWKVSYGGSAPIRLVRNDINENLAVSYLNIDALDEFVRLRSQLYSDATAIVAALEEDCEILDIRLLMTRIRRTNKPQRLQ